MKKYGVAGPEGAPPPKRTAKVAKALSNKERLHKRPARGGGGASGFDPRALSSPSDRARVQTFKKVNKSTNNDVGDITNSLRKVKFS